MAGKKKNIKEAQKKVLKENETVMFAIDGVYETQRLGTDSVKNSVLIATETRLVFFAKRLTGYESESFKYENISSLDSGKKLMGNTLSFYASGNEVKMKWIQDKEYDDFMNYVESRIGKSSAPTQKTEDNLEKLKKLKELLDIEAISQEEYDVKKKELLNIYEEYKRPN